MYCDRKLCKGPTPYLPLLVWVGGKGSMHLCHLDGLTPIQKPVFASTAFLIIFSWKTGGDKDDSPERRAVETGISLVDLISKRCGFRGYLRP